MPKSRVVKPDIPGLVVARVPKPECLSLMFQDFPVARVPEADIPRLHVVWVPKPGYLSHVFQDCPSSGSLSQAT